MQRPNQFSCSIKEAEHYLGILITAQCDADTIQQSERYAPEIKIWRKVVDRMHDGTWRWLNENCEWIDHPPTGGE